LAPDDTSSKLYEKLTSVWKVVEETLVQTNLEWLQGCLETQRLKFFLEVGQHLSAEATWLVRRAVGKFYENEDSFLVWPSGSGRSAIFGGVASLLLQSLKYG